MNYLAHALPFLTSDDSLAPWRMAGTSLPDWLRVVDKRARLHRHTLVAYHSDDHRHRALCEGSLRHLDDDLAFHTWPAFDDVAHDLTRDLRAKNPTLRASTLGHILTEMLLDAALMARDPTLLPRYYHHLDSINDAVVCAFARTCTNASLAHAETLVDRFKRSRFLFHYQDDDGMLQCLTGVCQRAGLAPPPHEAKDVIAAGRARVHELAHLVVDHAGGR